MPAVTGSAGRKLRIAGAICYYNRPATGACSATYARHYGCSKAKKVAVLVAETYGRLDVVSVFPTVIEHVSVFSDAEMLTFEMTDVVAVDTMTTPLAV